MLFGPPQEEQEQTEGHFALADSGHPITFYFKTSDKGRISRYNHFVLIPVDLLFIPHKNRESTLDFDSDQILGFTRSTLNMLANSHQKVFPFPLLTNVSEQKPLQNFQFAKCVPLIRNERQFEPCFDIVGHGTPYGIGPLDPQDQIPAHLFAQKMDELFQQHDLKTKLQSEPCHFNFHTCNSAYAEVHDQMTRKEILDTVYHHSYIGHFYAEMQKRGYIKISVTGYRGYYSAMNSSHASTARIQDAFFDQTFECEAKRCEYRIEANECQTHTTNQHHLTFPVKLLPRNAVVELLIQKTSQLKITNY